MDKIALSPSWLSSTAYRTSTSLISLKLVYLLFLGYIFFIPSGPYPFFVFGIQLDVFIGMLLFFVLIPQWPKFGISYPSLVRYTFYIYGAILAGSALFSNDIVFSLGRLVITLGYMTVMFLAPIMLLPYIRQARLLLFMAAVTIAALIVSLFTWGGYGEAYRFTLAASAENLNNPDIMNVDPNMTAIGLAMTILVYIPNMNHESKKLFKWSIEICCMGLIMAAVFITLSRTASLSFILASCLALGVISLRSFMGNKISIYKYMLVLTFIAALIPIFLFSFFLDDIYQQIFYRLSRIGQDTARLKYFQEAFQITADNVKNVVIGQGYFTTNPHNELIRHLSSSGFAGLAVFCLWLFTIYHTIVTKIRTSYLATFSALSLYFYSLFFIQTYGHTKSLWVTYMFILFLYWEQQYGLQKSISSSNSMK